MPRKGKSDTQRRANAATNAAKQTRAKVREAREAPAPEKGVVQTTPSAPAAEKADEIAILEQEIKRLNKDDEFKKIINTRGVLNQKKLIYFFITNEREDNIVAFLTNINKTMDKKYNDNILNIDIENFTNIQNLFLIKTDKDLIDNDFILLLKDSLKTLLVKFLEDKNEDKNEDKFYKEFFNYLFYNVIELNIKKKKLNEDFKKYSDILPPGDEKNKLIEEFNKNINEETNNNLLNYDFIYKENFFPIYDNSYELIVKAKELIQEKEAAEKEAAEKEAAEKEAAEKEAARRRQEEAKRQKTYETFKEIAAEGEAERKRLDAARRIQEEAEEAKAARRERQEKAAARIQEKAAARIQEEAAARIQEEAAARIQEEAAARKREAAKRQEEKKEASPPSFTVENLKEKIDEIYETKVENLYDKSIRYFSTLNVKDKKVKDNFNNNINKLKNHNIIFYNIFFVENWEYIINEKNENLIMNNNEYNKKYKEIKENLKEFSTKVLNDSYIENLIIKNFIKIYYDIIQKKEAEERKAADLAAKEAEERKAADLAAKEAEERKAADLAAKEAEEAKKKRKAAEAKRVEYQLLLEIKREEAEKKRKAALEEAALEEAEKRKAAEAKRNAAQEKTEQELKARTEAAVASVSETLLLNKQLELKAAEEKKAAQEKTKQELKARREAAVASVSETLLKKAALEEEATRLKKEEAAAIKIQKIARGNYTRKKALEIRAEIEERERTRAKVAVVAALKAEENRKISKINELKKEIEEIFKEKPEDKSPLRYLPKIHGTTINPYKEFIKDIKEIFIEILNNYINGNTQNFDNIYNVIKLDGEIDIINEYNEKNKEIIKDFQEILKNLDNTPIINHITELKNIIDKKEFKDIFFQTNGIGSEYKPETISNGNRTSLQKYNDMKELFLNKKKRISDDLPQEIKEVITEGKTYYNFGRDKILQRNQAKRAELQEGKAEKERLPEETASSISSTASPAAAVSAAQGAPSTVAVSTSAPPAVAVAAATAQEAKDKEAKDKEAEDIIINDAATNNFKASELLKNLNDEYNEYIQNNKKINIKDINEHINNINAKKIILYTILKENENKNIITKYIIEQIELTIKNLDDLKIKYEELILKASVLAPAASAVAAATSQAHISPEQPAAPASAVAASAVAVSTSAPIASQGAEEAKAAQSTSPISSTAASAVAAATTQGEGQPQAPATPAEEEGAPAAASAVAPVVAPTTTAAAPTTTAPSPVQAPAASAVAAATSQAHISPEQPAAPASAVAASAVAVSTSAPIASQGAEEAKAAQSTSPISSTAASAVAAATTQGEGQPQAPATPAEEEGAPAAASAVAPVVAPTTTAAAPTTTAPSPVQAPAASAVAAATARGATVSTEQGAAAPVAASSSTPSTPAPAAQAQALAQADGAPTTPATPPVAAAETGQGADGASASTTAPAQAPTTKDKLSYIIFQDIDNISDYYANVEKDNYKNIDSIHNVSLQTEKNMLKFKHDTVTFGKNFNNVSLILQQINDNIIKKNKYIIERKNDNKLYTIYDNDDIIAIIAEFNNKEDKEKDKRIFIIQAKANILKETLKLELVLFKDYFITNNLEGIYNNFGINNLLNI